MVLLCTQPTVKFRPRSDYSLIFSLNPCQALFSPYIFPPRSAFQGLLPRHPAASGTEAAKFGLVLLALGDAKIYDMEGFQPFLCWEGLG